MHLSISGWEGFAIIHHANVASGNAMADKQGKLGQPLAILALSGFKFTSLDQTKSPACARLLVWCRGRDLNPRRPKPSDLQSDTIDHSVTPA